MSVTPAPPNAWPFGPNQLTNRLVSVTPAVFAQTASPKKKVVLGVAQSEAKVLMVSTSAGANGRSPGCLPALRKFPMMPFELTAAPLLFTSRESRKARESSLEVDAEDEENNGTHISVTRATKAAMPDAVRLLVQLTPLYHGVELLRELSLGVVGPVLVPWSYVNPEVGTVFTLTAFVIVVLGGMGSVSGAFFGGLIIGVVTAVGQVFLPGTYGLIPQYLVFILLLFFRPEGLFSGRI